MVIGSLLVFATLLLVACGDDDDDDDAATTTTTTTATATATTTATEAADGGTQLSVSLGEWAVTPEVDAIDAGQVTFTIANEGTQPHDFVIIRSDEAPDALPVEAGAVLEDAVDLVTEIGPFPVGTTERLTVELAAGSYLLICNIAGHYQLGMTTAFTVN